MKSIQAFFGQKLRGSFLPEVVFAKGCEFLLVSLGEGFGVGFRGVVGDCFLVENEGKGEWGGEGGAVGCARVCQSYSLAIYPLVFTEFSLVGLTVHDH